MYRDSVPLLAGTDVPNLYTVPGSSLHDELALLVRAGLPPLAAIVAATSAAARFLGAEDSLGTIAPGKHADLVLLDASPLEEIRNTRRIAAVVAAGRLLVRTDLDRILARVEADRWRAGDAALVLASAVLQRIPLAARIGLALALVALVAAPVYLVRRHARRRA
jgi:adenine deaminase